MNEPAADHVGFPDIVDQDHPTLVVDGVSKTFDVGGREVHALKPLRFEVRQGEFVAIVGPSGCGKSTLLMMIAGLVRVTDGRVFTNGQAVTKPSQAVSLMFQDDLLLSWLDIRQNVVLPAKIAKLQRAEAEERADRLLEMVGLTARENAYPHQLSGGMRQRVALCRALLLNRPLLLMDEPLGSLDAMTREQMQMELLRICDSTDITVLFVTHSIDEAVILSDRVLVMKGSPGELTADVPVKLPRPRSASMRDSQELREIARTIRTYLDAE